MLLTKKDYRRMIRRIIITSFAYFLLGCSCIFAGVILSSVEVDATFLYLLGVISFLLIPIFVLLGRYAEGKGKLINLGNKLVRQELVPMKFIEQYEALRNSPDLYVNKPSIEVLELVAVAYDSLDEREKCLAAVEEMISVAGEKKKTLAEIIKTSFLFSYGRTEEAESLFNKLRERKMSAVCVYYKDSVFNSDRAMAMGDYKTVENHCLKMLGQKFPKLDNLGRLIINYKLGEVYEKLMDNEKATLHYTYCVDFGGETAIKNSAKLALERIR